MQDPSIANHLIDTLERYIGSSKTKESLRKCLENAIFMKIKTKYDIIQFLTFIRNLVNIDLIVSNINNIITSGSNNYEEQIENVYSQALGEKYNRVRLEYSMYLLLPYVRKLLNSSQSLGLEQEIRNYIHESNHFDNEDELFDSLNTIFLRYTGRDYNYFQTRYSTVVENQYIIRLFNRWKAPKFKITAKTIAIRTQPSLNRNLGTVIGPIGGVTDESAGDQFDALRELHRNVVVVKDKTLSSDNEKIRILLNAHGPNFNIGNAQSFWETNMFKYIHDHKLHPRESHRTALLIVTCWIYVMATGDKNLQIQPLVNTANQLGYNAVDSIPYAISLYNKMFTSAQNSQYKQVFMAKLGNYPIPFDKIESFLETKGLDSQTIRNIVDTLSKITPKNKKDREDHIYDLLKPIKSLKVTRKLVQSMIGAN